VILSKKYRFVFIKTNKTAGTSIELALSRHCGEKDIITPLLPEDEAKRVELGGRNSQKFLAPRSRDGPGRRVKTQSGESVIMRFYNHMPAHEIGGQLQPAFWQECFKFCVERNPWDRVVSYYYWANCTEPRRPFSEFVRSSDVMELKRFGSALYIIGDTVAVDRICCYETLDADLASVFEAVGIVAGDLLPNAKGQFRPREAAYGEHYNDDDRDVVAGIFRDEIETLGYAF